SFTQTQVREITVPVFIKANDISDLQKVKEDLAEWLIHDEPKELVFKDEPDRIYYAVVDGELDLDELVRWGQGIITFICPDPYKYGPEKTVETTSDTFIVENEGTAETEPIIELTATEKATFAMVSNGEEYMMIGKPAEVDEQIVDTKTRVLTERGETLDTWTSEGTQFDNGLVTGQLGTDGTGIHPLTDGDPGSWHGWYGHALLKEISPIQDYEVEMRLRAETTSPNQLYRIEFYLYDENFNVLGKMAIRDYAITRQRYAAEGRIGPFLGAGRNYLISQANYLRESNHFHGLVRMRRIGKRFEFYVARLRTGEQEGRHHDTLMVPFMDVNNEYQGKLRYVQINIARHTDGPSAIVPRINAIDVYELQEAVIDETPYIVYPGDIIEFDHVTKDIRLNGESRKDLKAFGGSFFTLKKGINTLTVTPENTFNTKITYRER